MTFDLIAAARSRHAEAEEAFRKHARTAVSQGLDPTPELRLVERHHRAVVACDRELSPFKIRKVA